MAKLIKNNLGNFWRIFLIFVLITGWFFSGWPQIWQKPPIPPEIQEAQAAAPTFQAAGTVVKGTTAAITVAWPAHAVGDIGLLIIENDNNLVGLGTNGADWTQLPSSPQGTGTSGGTGAAATRLTVFWSRAISTSMGSVVVNAVANHQIGQIITFRGVIASGNPYDVTAGDVAATTATAVSIPGGTTTVANTLVVAIVANGVDSATAQTSGWTNASLTSITENADNNTNGGNGGGFGVAAGVKAAASAYSATTATLATTSVQGRISLALKPSVATVATSGTQTANMDIGATNQDIGGKFTITTTGNTNITGITITETGTTGTVDGLNNLDNIKLYSENDTSAPYDCASESLSSPSSPTEAQFGTTDTTGFSAVDNGTSAFTGTVAITPTATMCVYVVLDVGAGASGNQTIDIAINASTDVTSSVADIGGTFPVAISGTTTINAAAVYSVTVSDGNVTYGTLNLNTSRSTLPGEENEMQTATNGSNVPAKINIKGTVSSPAGWTLAGTPGANVYVHQFCNDTDNDCSAPPTNYTALTTGYTQLKASVAVSGTVDFQLRITTPTEVSSYVEQDVDVWVQAVQPD